MPKHDYYVPSTKSELIKILTTKWPQDAKRFGVMGKKQLLAVFHKLRWSQFNISQTSV